MPRASECSVLFGGKGNFCECECHLIIGAMRDQQRFHALPVRWSGAPEATWTVSAEADLELTSTARVHEHAPGSYTAWLPCTPGQSYNVTAHWLSNRSDNMREIPDSVQIPLAKRLSQRLLVPGTRLADYHAALYTASAPVTRRVLLAIYTLQTCEVNATFAQLMGQSRSTVTVGGWRRRHMLLPPSPNESFWAAYNLNWFAVAFAQSGTSPYAKRALETDRAGPVLRAARGIKALVWEPHVPIDAVGGARVWVNFLQQEPGHNLTAAQLRPTINLILRPRPWMHVAADSILSSLAPVMIAWFGGAHSTTEPLSGTVL